MDNPTDQFNPDGYVANPTDASRKASEVLLSLENKVDTLTALVYNQDLLLKLAVDRCNKIYAYIEELQKEYREQMFAQAKMAEPEEEPRIVSSPPPEQVITEANINEQVGERRGMRTPSQTQVLPLQVSNNQEVEKPVQQDGKKIPVMQRVSDSNGKDMFMCDILILDESGKQVHKTKTSAVGKWQATLKPGQYTIKMKKTDTVSKKIIEATQQITINNSASTITLPVAIIKR